MAKVTMDGHEIDTLVLTPASGTAVSKTLVATNTYSSSDAGKVVKNTGSAYELVAQTARESSITSNGTYDTTENNSVTVSVSGGANLGTKTITQNGTYTASADNFDGYSSVEVAVSGSGSVLSGSFTPSANETSHVISSLVGTTLNHFLLKPTGDSSGPLNNSVRVIGPGFIDFTSGKECYFGVASNGAGTGYGSMAKGSTAGGTEFSFDRTTGTVSCQNAAGSGVLVSGVTYDWWAW